MANPYYTVTGDFNPDREIQSSLAPSLADIQAQLARVQQKLDAGQYVAPSEVPAPYHVVDGKLVENKGSLWKEVILPIALGVGTAGLGSWISGLSGIASPATAATTATGTTASATMPAAEWGIDAATQAALPGAATVAIPSSAVFGATTVAPAVTGGVNAGTVAGAAGTAAAAAAAAANSGSSPNNSPEQASTGGSTGGSSGGSGSDPNENALDASEGGGATAASVVGGKPQTPSNRTNPLSSLIPNKQQLIGTGVQGLFDYLGKKNTGNAIDKATQTQTQATKDAIAALTAAMDKSLSFQEQQWAQAQENIRPWLGYGRGAEEALGQLMGLTPDYPSQTALPSTTAPAPPVPNIPGGGHTNPNPPGTSPIAVPRGSVPTATTAGYTPPVMPQTTATPPPTTAAQPGVTYAQPRSSTSSFADMYGSRRRGPASSLGAQPQSGMQPQSQDASSDMSATTTVQWPNGVEQQVPAYQVSQYEALGAKRVSNSQEAA